MSTPLSTEARIFAANVRREAQRREQILASALSGGRGRVFEAVKDIRATVLRDDRSPIANVQYVRKLEKTLRAIPSEDRAFGLLAVEGRRRTVTMNMLVVSHDHHPLAAIEGEPSLVVSSAKIAIARAHDRVATAPIAAISEHTIGRLHERASRDLGVGNVLGAAAMVGTVTTLLSAATGEKHAERGMTFRVADDTYVTGVMRVGVGKKSLGRKDIGVALLFFDGRSCLTGAMLAPEQMRQAFALERFAEATKEGDLSLADTVPVVEARDDYIRRLQMAVS